MKNKNLLKALFGSALLASMGSAFAGTSFSVDIVETGNNVFTDPSFLTPVNDATIPGVPPFIQKGSKILIQGNLYPAGTIDAHCQNLGNNPCIPPVQPIGQWYCYATILSDIGPGKPFVLGDQIYDFTTSPKSSVKLSTQAGTGANVMISLGYENSLADVNLVANRAVVGGTGAFRAAHGEMKVKVVGFGLGGQQPLLSSDIDYTQQ
jgi:hypothetical protein